jgi:peptide/nickel transport system ATP-binding protein
MQLIFQDPLASLNPRMTIGEAISHPAQIHLTDQPAEQRRLAFEILEKVGLAPAQHYYSKFPHQISGGQRQRVAIARALITVPELIVADEPIAMADVSVRALLLDLMMKLKQEFNLTYLFITHDLATAKYICDRIGVLYLGKMCEMGPLDEVYRHPAHPYTRALLDAIPIPDPMHRRTTPMPRGEIPSAINPPSGCRFHPRCPIARPKCSVEEPALREVRPGHFSACHYAEELLT